MIEPVSDPIAVQVTDDMALLRDSGVVQYCGWVKVETLADGETPDPGVANFRIYTSPSFDRWLEIPRDIVVAQLGPSFESQGRSYIWVKADAPIDQSLCATAMYVAHTMDAGGDPTAYPHGR